MKRTILLFVATAFFPFMVLASPPRKIALIVAVGNYPESTGWQKIHAENDARMMEELLMHQGFEKRNITILENEKATREGILKAINQYLIERAAPGDVLFFQFSGHGQQIADDNQDELDGFDEAIVPFDSPMHYGQNGYTGQNLIRDEELGALLQKARKRIGPTGNLLVIVDACHSGTGLRGMGSARGTDEVMADSSYHVSHRATGKENGMLQTENSNELAPEAAFFGSSAGQLNYETKDEKGAPIGSLTYALCKKLSTASAATTYRSLFDQVRLEMTSTAPSQQPQSEGMLDQQIFGGAFVENPKDVRIKRALSTKNILLGAGWMEGLNEGSVIGLFPLETVDPAKVSPLMKGTVRTSTPFESILALDSAVQKRIITTSRAFVLEKNYGDLKAEIQIQVPANDPLAKALRAQLASIPVISEKSEHPDLYLIQQDGKIRLMSGPFTLLESNPHTAPEMMAKQFIQKIMAWAQAAYLRELQTPEEETALQLELIPVKATPKGEVQEELPIQEKIDAFGNIRFQLGDKVIFKVTNHGELGSFFTLIDISPNNQIAVVVPTQGKTSDDFFVRPGQTLTIPGIFEFTPPKGTEQIKLIATDQAVDLSPIVQTRGVQNRPKSTPLEKLFAQTYFNEETMSRGGKTANIPPGTMSVKTVSFIIE